MLAGVTPPQRATLCSGNLDFLVCCQIPAPKLTGAALRSIDALVSAFKWRSKDAVNRVAAQFNARLQVCCLFVWWIPPVILLDSEWCELVCTCNLVAVRGALYLWSAVLK